jgi:hypothetical protein
MAQRFVIRGGQLAGKSAEALQLLQAVPAHAEGPGWHFVAFDAQLLVAKLRFNPNCG